MSANAKQVAGNHYQNNYQHWDFMCDTGMHYLLGCASKYVIRFRKKNGMQDLEKAIHYLEKAQEVKIPALIPEPEELAKVQAGSSDHAYVILAANLFDHGQKELSYEEGVAYAAVLSMLFGCYDVAIERVRELQKIMIIEEQQIIKQISTEGVIN
jgi:hypothetical protein